MYVASLMQTVVPVARAEAPQTIFKKFDASTDLPDDLTRPKKASSLGKLSYVQGGVTINNKPASLSQEIKPGSVVEAKSDGRATIVIRSWISRAPSLKTKKMKRRSVVASKGPVIATEATPPKALEHIQYVVLLGDSKATLTREGTIIATGPMGEASVIQGKERVLQIARNSSFVLPSEPPSKPGNKLRCDGVLTSGQMSGVLRQGLGDNGTISNRTMPQIATPSGVVQIQDGGRFFIASSTANHRYQCVDLLSGSLQAQSSQYGSSAGSQSFNYSCTGGKYIYGLNVGSDASGAFSGFTLGVNCRSCVAGTYWTGGTCKAVGIGYYSTGSGNRTACSNLPADPFASYSSSYSTSSNCDWSCSGGRKKQLNAATSQYSCVPYVVQFDANGGSGTVSSQSLTTGSSANLNPNSFTRSEFLFAGWATSPTGAVVYNDQDLFTMGSADVTLYAVWTSPTALVVKYDFNTQTANDQSGNERHGYASNVNYVSDGSGGYAASFNGENSYVQLPNDLLRSNTTFTLMMRFKAEPGNHGALFGYQNSEVFVSPGEWVPVLAVRSDGKLHGELWTTENSLAITTATAVNDGQWHTVYFSGTSGSIKLYLDGVLIGSNQGTVLGLSMIYNQIGAARSNGRAYLAPDWSFFNGLIKSFYMYNTAL
jgi:hypothetical protein